MASHRVELMANAITGSDAARYDQLLYLEQGSTMFSE